MAVAASNALGDVVDKEYKPEYKWKTRNKTGMDKWYKQVR